MYAVLQQYGGYVLAGVLVVGGILFWWRARVAQVAYLKKFPPVNGVPLEMFLGGNPGGAEAQAIARVSRTHQADPQLERLRQEMRRSYRHFIYWVFGFPMLAIAAGALVLAFFPH